MPFELNLAMPQFAEDLGFDLNVDPVTITTTLKLDMGIGFDVSDLPTAAPISAADNMIIDEFEFSVGLDAHDFDASLEVPGLGTSLVVEGADIADSCGGMNISLPNTVFLAQALLDAIETATTQLDPSLLLNLLEFDRITSIDVALPITTSGAISLEEWGTFVLSMSDTDFFDAVLPKIGIDVTIGTN